MALESSTHIITFFRLDSEKLKYCACRVVAQQSNGCRIVAKSPQTADKCNRCQAHLSVCGQGLVANSRN